MKILVAVKQVAALDEDFEFRDDGRDVDPDFFIRDLNEWDDFSLEEAVKIKEASTEPTAVVAVSTRRILAVKMRALSLSTFHWAAL